MDLNEILSSLGEFDRFQLYLYCLSLYPSIMAGIVVLSPVFLLGQPSHRCFVDSCDQYMNFNDSWHKFAFPNDTLGKIDSCRFFKTKELNVSCDASSFTNEVKECTSFVYNHDEFKDTAVTERYFKKDKLLKYIY
ncbi:organic cation transporter protein-like protein [Leptotrombidium deliense]|uniref:Organic cation transporter protein-like protein n=1 Tax=Leptotrombidium deliense TaxID=299467 RepID=A0A443SG83_9ACAR|nr:organic cation transporter protein-like protein [Leptotrombidium deliense]